MSALHPARAAEAARPDTSPAVWPEAPVAAPLPALGRHGWAGRLVGAGAALALLCVLIGALGGARHQLQQQRAERQAQAVQALAPALARLQGELPERLAALRHWPLPPGALRITDEGGRVLADWSVAGPVPQAPRLFVQLLSSPPAPALATAAVGPRTLAIELHASVADVLDRWWQWGGLGLLVLGALVAGLQLLWQRQLQALRSAAQARQSTLLAQQQALFDVQAEQLEQLRQQAHTDALTGLYNRRHFLGGLSHWLAGQGATPQGGLVLLRLRDLAGMNQRLGRASTDRVLQALAQVLAAYPQRIERCLAGRLNGADFALLLPAAGVAQETAHSLLQALRAAIDRIDPQASVAAGALEIPPHAQAAPLLASADAALAEAELAGRYAVVGAGDTALLVDAAGQPVGELAWQRRIGRALALGHVALGAFPVCTPDGRALMLDCPLRVRFEPDGPLEPAQRWLSLAVRSRLSAEVDDKALALALSAIARDGVARCINMSADAVAEPEFVASVSRRLALAPDAACRLWIDLPESLALERPTLVRELSQRWRPLGAMLALEHAGEGLMRIHRLIDLGLDCVRIDGRFVNGVAEPDAQDARRYLQGLVRLVQSVGLQVTAEGVQRQVDLDALWALGFDAATGPAVVGTPVPVSATAVPRQTAAVAPPPTSTAAPHEAMAA